MKKILETERLYLRQFTMEDAPVLFEMHADPDITKYTGDPHPWDSLESTEKIIRDIILPQYENNLGRWAVHLKSNGVFLGWCGLKNVGMDIDLGYRFCKQYWGNGYATESARAVLDYGHHVLKLRTIVGRVSEENIASVNVLKKIGLVFQEHYYDNGESSFKFSSSIA